MILIKQLKLSLRVKELLKFWSKPLHDPIPVEKQVLILYALTHGYLDAIPVEDISRFQNELFDNFDSSHADLFKTIQKLVNYQMTRNYQQLLRNSVKALHQVKNRR